MLTFICTINLVVILIRCDNKSKILLLKLFIKSKCLNVFIGSQYQDINQEKINEIYGDVPKSDYSNDPLIESVKDQLMEKELLESLPDNRLKLVSDKDGEISMSKVNSLLNSSV